MTPVALAIDLGGTRIRAALVTEDGTVRFHAEEPTPARDGPEAVLSRIAALAGAALASAPVGAVKGAGVCAPGPLDTGTGMALGIQSLSGFADFPLRAELERRLGLAVTLENDGIAGAVGEWRHGAGRGAADMVYLTLSTGIGGGVIADGRPLRGARGLAGHVGHMLFRGEGPRHPGGHMPCLEDFASGPALAYRAREAMRDGTVSSLATAEPLDARAIFAAAGAGDGLAERLVRDEAETLGLGLTSLLHILNPERIVIGGGMSAALPALLPSIRETIVRNAKPGFAEVDILPAGLGQSSCLIGAATLVFAPDLGARRQPRS
ncbi:MAG: ROK family protein [Paracoccaceae bacterium]